MSLSTGTKNSLETWVTGLALISKARCVVLNLLIPETSRPATGLSVVLISLKAV